MTSVEKRRNAWSRANALVLILWGLFSALGCAVESASQEALATSSQAIEVSETIPFSMTFTRVHVGHDGCGSTTEPQLRSFRINDVELEPARVNLPDCPQNSSCSTNVTFSSDVPTSSETIVVTVQLWERDGGLCWDDNPELSLELEIDPFCGEVVGGRGWRWRGGLEEGSIPAGATSAVFGRWGYDWEINGGDADADGDGIPDCWERQGTVDLDGDGQIDLNFTGEEVDGVPPLHPLPADPLVPDIYVEVDWMDCNLGGCEALPRRYCEAGEPDCSEGDPIPDTRSFMPDYPTMLQPVEQVFLEHGYNLHFVMSEAIPVSGLIHPEELEDGEERTTENSSFDLRNDFETARNLYLEYLGHPGDSEVVREAKRRFVRYNIWSHARDTRWYGDAWAFGDLFHVSHDPGACDSAAGTCNVDGLGPRASIAEARQFWAEIAMHELGHSLGLQHGGRDGRALKPSYFSVMRYGYNLRVRDASGTEGPRILNYNEYANSLNECELDENQPVLALGDPRFVMRWYCPEDVPVRGDKWQEQNGAGVSWPNPEEVQDPDDMIVQWVDWDCDGDDTGVIDVPLDLDGDRVCVRPGANKTLDTIPSGDDRVMGGRIVPAEGNTVVLSNPHVDDDVAADGTITAGEDGILQTEKHPDDRLFDAVIVDGDDRLCDTSAQGDDAQSRSVCDQAERDADYELIGDDPPTARCHQPCVIEAWNDWQNLRVALKGNGVSGEFENLPVEEPEEVWRAAVRASNLADLMLTSTGALGSGRAGRDVTLTYTIDNGGPDSAFGATLNLRLPTGVELVGCSAPGGQCFRVGSVAAASFDAIPSGESMTVTIVVRLGCEILPGDEVELRAKVISQSLDRDRSSNFTSDRVQVLGFLGFEDAGRPWVVSHTGGSQEMPVVSGNSTEGDHGLALGCGHTQFESPVFDTVELGAVGEELLVDVFVPEAEWQGVGGLSLTVDVPAAGVHHEWVGMVSLNGLPQGTWSTVSIPLTASARAALLQDHPHARLRFASNVGLCGVSVLLDHVRFGGDLECQERDGAPEPITSSSVLTFDQLSDWSSQQVSLASTNAHVTQGVGAVEFGPLSRAELVSRPFAAQELVGVTSRLGFDVRIPELPADFYWLGHMNAYVECPSVGLYRTYLGYHALQILYAGAFNRVEFSVPSDVVSALQGGAEGCRFRLGFAANTLFGPMIIDNGGFMAEGGS